MLTGLRRDRTTRAVWVAPDQQRVLSRAIVDLRVENYMINKPALLVFYGLIIASVTVWVSLAVTML